ncbi:MAG: hypothetical protein ABEJ31_05200 [Haloarculaceae archaeon]
MTDRQAAADSPETGLSAWLDETAEHRSLVEPFNDDLWLDGLTRRLGFGWLAARLPVESKPGSLFAVLMVGTLVPVVNAYAYHIGAPVVYIRNPFFVLQPIFLVAGVFGARSLRRRYDRVTREMRLRERADEPELLVDIVPQWLPWALFVLALVQNFARVWALGGFGAIYREAGPTGVVGWALLNPLWSALAVQFVVVYVAIEFIAPWRLYRSSVGIDFLDPEGLGGLRPLGELVKHAYYYMGVALVGFALVVYGPVLSAESWGPTATTSVVFTAIWLGTVATVAFAVFVLHRFMHREKRQELQRLNAALREAIDNPWDVTTYTVAADKRELVDDLRQRIETVSGTSEYPATFSIWSQLLVSILLPKGFQLLLSAL